jgi:hypothetical protein
MQLCKKLTLEDWRCSSGVEHLPSMHETLQEKGKEIELEFWEGSHFYGLCTVLGVPSLKGPSGTQHWYHRSQVTLLAVSVLGLEIWDSLVPLGGELLLSLKRSR